MKTLQCGAHSCLGSEALHAAFVGRVWYESMCSAELTFPCSSSRLQSEVKQDSVGGIARDTLDSSHIDFELSFSCCAFRNQIINEPPTFSDMTPGGVKPLI